MALRLTPEQEDRLQAVVESGAYASPEDALDAAVQSVEASASLGFEGDAIELQSLLAEGFATQELTEDEFWGSVDRETTKLLKLAEGKST